MDRIRWVSFPILICVIGCRDQAGTKNKYRGVKMSVPKAPWKWTKGPSLQPACVLVDWIERHARTETGTRRLFRLPVVVRFDLYRIAIESACIGTSEADMDSSSVHLRLDDTGMGMSLPSQLRVYCKDHSRVCAVWLEGYWGPLVELPLPELGSDERSKPFTVLKVIGAINALEGDARPLVLSGP